MLVGHVGSSVTRRSLAAVAAVVPVENVKDTQQERIRVTRMRFQCRRRRLTGIRIIHLLSSTNEVSILCQELVEVLSMLYLLVSAGP